MHHIEQVDLRGVVVLVVDCVRRTAAAVEVEPDPINRRLHAQVVQQLPLRQQH